MGAGATFTKTNIISTSATPLRRQHIVGKMGPKKKSATPTPASALEQLQKSQSLKLLEIAETLAPKDLPQTGKKRNSGASEDSEQNSDTHPAALEADLTHYKVCRTFQPAAEPIS